jgi:hypothetical protein
LGVGFAALNQPGCFVEGALNVVDYRAKLRRTEFS